MGVYSNCHYVSSYFTAANIDLLNKSDDVFESNLERECAFALFDLSELSTLTQDLELRSKVASSILNLVPSIYVLDLIKNLEILSDLKSILAINPEAKISSFWLTLSDSEKFLQGECLKMSKGNSSNFMHKAMKIEKALKDNIESNENPYIYKYRINHRIYLAHQLKLKLDEYGVVPLGPN